MQFEVTSEQGQKEGSKGGPVGDPAALDPATPVVRVDILQGFCEVVGSRGGDAASLLSKIRIHPATLKSADGVIPYRSFVHLLERTATELEFPDIGMQLAALQGCRKILGPIAVAMRNSETFAQAFRYAIDHTQAFYSTAVRTEIQDFKSTDSARLRFEILLSGLPHQRQAVEQALLLTANNAAFISGGRLQPRAVWFRHEPLADLATYRRFFGTDVLFRQAENALVFPSKQLALSIPEADDQLYMLATSYLEHQLPRVQITFASHVRALVERLFKAGDFTHESVSSALGMHPRTLRRRLQAENATLEQIRDDVRKDMALNYLEGTNLALIEIVKLLGFSEASVLSRNCKRWFAATPKQLRRGSAQPAQPERDESTEGE